MELSTYFRINAQETGQFERTLIIADEGAYVSYLEGCTAPKRDENQLHAAVVELVALDGAEIKYSTVQNWYPGDEEGRGGIYNFVTKRGDCRGAQFEDLLDAGGDGLGHHLEISELHPARRQFRGRVLFHRHHQQLPAGRYRHEDDPSGQEHPLADHLERHQRRARTEHLSRARQRPSARRERAQLHAMRFTTDRDDCGAHTVPYIESRNRTARIEHEATTSKIADDQLFYCTSRGIPTEEAVALIVNGFCKEVLQQLPMEFAVEAQKLVGISLEGSVG